MKTKYLIVAFEGDDEEELDARREDARAILSTHLTHDAYEGRGRWVVQGRVFQGGGVTVHVT